MSSENEIESSKMEIDDESSDNSNKKGDADNDCFVIGDPSTPTVNPDSKLTHNSKSKSKLTSAQKIETAKKRQEEKVTISSCFLAKKGFSEFKIL